MAEPSRLPWMCKGMDVQREAGAGASDAVAAKNEARISAVHLQPVRFAPICLSALVRAKTRRPAPKAAADGVAACRARSAVLLAVAAEWS